MNKLLLNTIKLNLRYYAVMVISNYVWVKKKVLDMQFIH